MLRSTPLRRLRLDGNPSTRSTLETSSALRRDSKYAEVIKLIPYLEISTSNWGKPYRRAQQHPSADFNPSETWFQVFVLNLECKNGSSSEGVKYLLHFSYGIVANSDTCQTFTTFPCEAFTASHLWESPLASTSGPPPPSRCGKARLQCACSPGVLPRAIERRFASAPYTPGRPLSVVGNTETVTLEQSGTRVFVASSFASNTPSCWRKPLKGYRSKTGSAVSIHCAYCFL